jgi:DNA-directed RNA polymerase subunit RPC12/RpoP
MIHVELRAQTIQEGNGMAVRLGRTSAKDVLRCLNEDGRCATCGYHGWMDGKTTSLQKEITCMSCGERVTVLPDLPGRKFLVHTVHEPEPTLRVRWLVEGRTPMGRMDLEHFMATHEVDTDPS